MRDWFKALMLSTHEPYIWDLFQVLLDEPAFLWESQTEVRNRKRDWERSRFCPMWGRSRVGRGGAGDWKQGRGRKQAMETAPTLVDRHKHYLVPSGPLIVTPGPVLQHWYKIRETKRWKANFGIYRDLTFCEGTQISEVTKWELEPWLRIWSIESKWK